MKLNFTTPFSGFASTTFINCFASVYLFLNGNEAQKGTVVTTFCNEWVNGRCDSCGNCATKPQAIQEKYFFLFDTICGHSALRCRVDGEPTGGELIVNGGGYSDSRGGFYNAGSKDNIDFIFGYAGYDYSVVNDKTCMRAELEASIERGYPVIAKLVNNEVPFAVITGFDEDKLICPNFKCAQKSPCPEVAYDGIEELYIIKGKTEPKYKLTDVLKRIINIMEMNLSEKLWDNCASKIGTYGSGNFGGDNPEGKKARMKRLAEMMWHVFNCHNFAEVFRAYLSESPAGTLYEGVNDTNRLASPGLSELLRTVSWRYGYTHDLAWSIIGLEECLKLDDWKAKYYGDMLEIVILKLKENDEAVLGAVNNILSIIEKE